MTRVSIAILLVTTGCAARAGFGITGPTAVVPIVAPPSSVEVVSTPGIEPQPGQAPAPAESAGSYAPGEDQHWFASDDYLVSSEPYNGQHLTVWVAKMVAAPGAQTKAEGHFLRANGEDMWTSHYYRSRVAVAADLRVGALAFCFDGGGNIANPPQDKRDAKQRMWELAAITDTADMYKGRVTIGSTSCALAAIRMPVN